jgi:cytochrome c oxidase subunit 3
MASVSTQYNQNRIHPHKFALWVGIAGIMMMFAAFTSAYIVRRASGNWFEFKLPDIFMVNALVMLLSSVTIHLSYKAFVNGREQMYKGMLVLTAVLGLLFVALQYKGWEALTAIGATFTINPSSSFIYVISGLHAAHVLGGIVALMVALTHALVLPFKPTLRRRQRFQLVVTYWHFVDILWAYLVIFFIMQS